MENWIALGEFYVRPIDWEELYVIQPDGVQYVVYRHHMLMSQRVLIGTAPTPAAAARLVDESRQAAVGGQHNPREHREQWVREQERRRGA